MREPQSAAPWSEKPITTGHPALRLTHSGAQQHRASGLNLLVTAIILWNTRYLERAVAALRQVETAPDPLLAHFSPLGSEHVNLTGDYVWGAPQQRVGKPRRIAATAAGARTLPESRLTFWFCPPMRTRRPFREFWPSSPNQTPPLRGAVCPSTPKIFLQGDGRARISSRPRSLCLIEGGRRRECGTRLRGRRQ